MSTVPEVIVARQGGMRVLGFSGISNKANLDGNTPTTHAEVLQAGALIVHKLEKSVRGVLAEVKRSGAPARQTAGSGVAAFIFCGAVCAVAVRTNRAGHVRGCACLLAGRTGGAAKPVRVAARAGRRGARIGAFRAADCGIRDRKSVV